MRENCRDCGKPIGEISDDRPWSTKTGGPLRADICDGCWKTRSELVAGEIVPRGGPEFLKIQKAMARGRGTAKRLIDKARTING